MATVQHGYKSLEAYYDPREHHVFFEQFGPAERQQMLEDDLVAGRTVPLLLASVIVAGVILATISVLALW